MSEVTAILLACQDQNPQVRNAAEAQINAARDSNLAGFLIALIHELREEGRPATARLMAGIVLKNSIAFNSKEEEKKVELETKWRGLSADIRNQVKGEVLATLGSPDKEVRGIAALVVANIARIELPHGEWSDLLKTLVDVCASTNPQHTEAALTTLGYICEESNNCDPLFDVLQASSSAILNVVCGGMSSASEEIKYYATNALVNALEFCKNNMEVEAERNYLISMICQNTTSSNLRTREKAMACIEILAECYYKFLPQYMAQLQEITAAAIARDQESVALLALDFWIVIAETEVELHDEPSEEEPLHNIISHVKRPLVGLLVEALQKQVEDQTDDDWNISLAASKCLQVCAQDIGTEIVEVVLPFVFSNVNAANWRQQEAAVMAFGCILNGPDADALKDTVAQAVPGLLTYSQSPHPLLQDTSVWVLSQVASNFSDALLYNDQLPKLFNVIAPCLAPNRPASVTARALTVIHHLCLHFEDEPETEAEGLTNALSQYYPQLVEALIGCIDRPNGHEANLRNVAQETFNALIDAAARDVFPVLLQLIPVFLERLKHTLVQVAANGSDAHRIAQVQGLTCGALNAITRKVGVDILPQAPTLMEAYLAVFGSDQTTVLEEGLMALGQLAQSMAEGFTPYLAKVIPYIARGLQTVDEFQLCTISIGVVSDIVTAVHEGIAPYCDSIMNLFLAQATDRVINRDLKAPIIGCIGDIALSIGANFSGYLDKTIAVLQTLDQPSRAVDTKKDNEMTDYVMDLWESMCECLTGIMQGLKDSPQPAVKHLPWIIDFITFISPRCRSYEDVFSRAVATIGDIAAFTESAFRRQRDPSLKRAVLTDAIYHIVKEGTHSKDEHTREQASWAAEQVTALEQLR